MELSGLEIFKDVKRKAVSRALLMKNGRIYFTGTAIKDFNLDEAYFNIATNPNDNEKNIYLIRSEKDDSYAVGVTKAGNLNTKNFFAEKNIDPVESPFKYKIKKGGDFKGKEVIILEFDGERKRRERKKGAEAPSITL